MLQRNLVRVPVFQAVSRSAVESELLRSSPHFNTPLRWSDRSSGRTKFGDSLRDATALGKLRPGQPFTRSGEVDDNDPDYFRMTVRIKGGRDNLRLKLSNQENDDETIYGAILNRRGRVITAAKFEAGKTNILGFNNISGGVYYIRLTTWGDQVDYQFTVGLV